MAIIDKNNDGQVQEALIEQIGSMETHEEISEVKSDLRIATVTDTIISNVNENVITGTCTINAVDEEDDDYTLYADYELEIDEDGEVVKLQYSNVELNIG